MLSGMELTEVSEKLSNVLGVASTLRFEDAHIYGPRCSTSRSEGSMVFPVLLK